MDNRQLRTVTSYRRILDHLDQHPLVPTPPLLQRMRTELQVSVQKMERLALDQVGAQLRVDGVPARTGARTLRREKMMPLVRVAAPLLKFAPGVERVMRVPHARTDTLSVANAALAMVKVLKPHQKLLVSAGLQRDFLAEMRREAEALAVSAQRAAKVRSVRSQATAALARELKEAKKRVTVIEGILMFHQKDTVKLFLWKHDRRVGARMGRPKRKKTPPIS